MKTITFAPDEGPLPRRQLGPTAYFPVSAPPPPPPARRAGPLEARDHARQVLATTYRIIPVLTLLNQASRLVLVACEELAARSSGSAQVFRDVHDELIWAGRDLFDVGDKIEETAKRLLDHSNEEPASSDSLEPAKSPEAPRCSLLPNALARKAGDRVNPALAMPAPPLLAKTDSQVIFSSPFLPRAKHDRSAAHCSRRDRRRTKHNKRH